MMTPMFSHLSSMPPLDKLDTFYSIATALRRNMAMAYEGLAEKMNAIHNAEASGVFASLTDREKSQIERVNAVAESVGARADGDVDEVWQDQAFQDDVAQEIAENPYLMTPYRAYQLAVINKERMFQILSAIAARQDDAVIQQHAEEQARDVLSEISELRLKRRQASRSEVKTAIELAGLGSPPADLEQFSKAVEVIHAIVRTMVVLVKEIYQSELTDETNRMLDGVVNDFNDFPDALMPDDGKANLESRVRQENDSLFSTLKALLRELESAADLFLDIADGSVSEDVVMAAQTKAERYVHRIAKIRDDLNKRIPE